MTRGRLLEATALVGALMAVSGVALAVTLEPPLGAAMGVILGIAGGYAGGAALLKRRRLDASVAAAAVPSGAPPVVIAALVGVTAAAMGVLGFVKLGSSLTAWLISVAAVALVIAAGLAAVRWSRPARH